MNKTRADSVESVSGDRLLELRDGGTLAYEPDKETETSQALACINNRFRLNYRPLLLMSLERYGRATEYGHPTYLVSKGAVVSYV